MEGASTDRPGRRDVLAGLAAAALAPGGQPSAQTAAQGRVRPGEPGWPSNPEWGDLGRATGGRLQPVSLPDLDPAAAPKLLSDPFYLRDQAGLTQSSGWIDAWRSEPSAYVVRARDAADVSAAVRFAARHRLRLVVKGGGHSYLGGSNAPDSLLVWTRDMDTIDLHSAFVPQGSHAPPTPAVSVGAGCVWLHVYQAVTTQAGSYVQGGGCTSVGVAGLVQGGGFGSFSKRFGLAAASLLEAEVVTADGAVRTVNADQEPELFWALKGGGGGTFGVVTRLTLKTHELPPTFGFAAWSVAASSDAAFRTLLERFIDLYATKLFNPHWGEQVTADGRSLKIRMLFEGLDQAAARDAWTPLADFVVAHPQDYKATSPLLVAAFPAQAMWSEGFILDHLPSAITVDPRPDAKAGDWWWTGDGEQVGTFWHGYHSAWIPASLLEDASRERLVQAWFDASRLWSTAFHFNKGLAGAPPEAVAAAKDTAMNPQVLDAFALVIIADDGPSAYPGMPKIDEAHARDDAERMRRATAAIRTAAPDAGSYVSECDYALADWRKACWGEHWARLDRIKRRYDPQDLFIVHHGVGSDRWSEDGFNRVA